MPLGIGKIVPARLICPPLGKRPAEARHQSHEADIADRRSARMNSGAELYRS